MRVDHGRPLLFVHGLMVHAAFWRKVEPGNPAQVLEEPVDLFGEGTGAAEQDARRPRA